MRLWHEALIPHLPRQQILGQHREIAALRGNGWGKKHRTVDYVFDHSPIRLFAYHKLIMAEMKRRGYKPNVVWENVNHRGKNCEPYNAERVGSYNSPVYPEHNNEYLQECIENLQRKGINISLEVTT